MILRELILKQVDMEFGALSQSHIFFNPRAKISFSLQGAGMQKQEVSETPGVTGKFGLGIQNEAEKRKANGVLPRQRTGHSNHPLPTTQENTRHGHNQMANKEIRLIIFFAAKDGEALHSQQKEDQELTAAQIMNSLLQN